MTDNGLSQKGLADAGKVNVNTLRRWLGVKQDKPSTPTLTGFTEFVENLRKCGISVNWIDTSTPPAGPAGDVDRGGDASYNMEASSMLTWEETREALQQAVERGDQDTWVRRLLVRTFDTDPHFKALIKDAVSVKKTRQTLQDTKANVQLGPDLPDTDQPDR
jgi:hypothetical protein